MTRPLGFALLAALLAGAAQADPVTIRVPSKSVAPGATYGLMLQVSGADSLAGLRLLITYRPDRDVAAAAPGVVGSVSDRRGRVQPLTAYPDSSGTLGLAWVSASGVAGVDSLANLSFTGRSAQGTRDTVQVTVLEAVTVSGRTVGTQVEPGVVTFTNTSDVGLAPTPPALQLRASPNPSPGGMLFRLMLPRRDAAQVEIFDVSGRMVASLWNDIAGPGELQLTWGGERTSRAGASSGLYFVQVTQGVARARTRFVLLR
jgi:hypothetical protein